MIDKESLRMMIKNGKVNVLDPGKRRWLGEATISDIIMPLIHSKAMTSTELSKEIGHSTSTISLVLRKLEKQGNIAAYKKPYDRKIYYMRKGAINEKI